MSEPLKGFLWVGENILAHVEDRSSYLREEMSAFRKNMIDAWNKEHAGKKFVEVLYPWQSKPFPDCINPPTDRLYAYGKIEFKEKS